MGLLVAINISPVTDGVDEDHMLGRNNLVNNPVITDTKFIKVFQIPRETLRTDILKMCG